MTRAVDLIQVPYHAGDDRHGSSLGPRRLIEAGAADRLHISGRAVTVERVDRGAPFRDTASSAAATNRRLAATVARAVAADLLPVVLSGSCNSCMGVLAGFDHSRCGAVWIDAHADFNTPESSASGFFPGMSLAVVTGHCYRDYWGRVGEIYLHVDFDGFAPEVAPGVVDEPAPGGLTREQAEEIVRAAAGRFRIR